MMLTGPKLWIISIPNCELDMTGVSLPKILGKYGLRAVASIVAMGFALCLHSATAVADSIKPQIMLLGVFHFANPGLDAVKTEDVNVMTDQNQAYLEGLAQRLAAFKPTQVLLEYEPEADAVINERYEAYLDGKFELRANEIYQLGFRVAKAATLKQVGSFDDRSIGWDAEPLFAYLESDDVAAKEMMDGIYAEMATTRNENQRTLGLRELLLLNNDVQGDNTNKGLYLLTNQVGTADNPVGATAAASWWHRNFNMFAKIQRAALAEGPQRILVIGGQGHTAILKDFLRWDSRLEAVQPDDYL